MIKSVPARTVLIGTLVAATAVTGCGASSGNRPSTQISTPTAVGPTPQHAIPESAFSGDKPFTGPAVTEFGQAPLEAAYREMVNFAFEAGWNSSLIPKDHTRLASADLAVVRSYLTPAARKILDDLFLKVVQGDKAATQKLEELVLFGIGGSNGLKPVATGSLVTDRRFTPPSVSVDQAQEKKRLVMAFAARATIQLVDSAGRRQVVKSSRVLEYTLVPNTGADATTRPFLADTWKIRLTLNRPEAA